MKIAQTSFALIMSIFAFNAHAFSLWEMNGAKMDIDGKDIRVASVKAEGSGHVFHSHDKELEKGVYVVATLDEASTEMLPNTTALIRDYLRSRGLNVVDKPDGCALALKFEVQGLSIDGAAAPSTGQAARTSGRTGGELIVVAGTANLIAKSTGAFAGAAAFAGAGSYHYTGELLTLTAVSVTDPTVDKLGVNTAKFGRDKNIVTGRTAVKQSDPKTTTGDLLTVMTKVWADKYFVKD